MCCFRIDEYFSVKNLVCLAHGVNLYDNDGKRNGMMTMYDVFAVLDIGTSKVVCLLVQPDDSPQGFSVLGHSVHACSGLSKGSVVDINQTVHAVKTAISEVEQASGHRIREVILGMSGHHVSSVCSNGVVGVRGQEIRQVVVDRVFEAAKAVSLPDNQTMLHLLPQEFLVDGQEGVTKPVGMAGVRLEARVLLMMVSTTSLQNVVKCVESCGLRVSNVVGQQLASAAAVLSSDERDLGVCLLDIGAGTTDISIYSKRSLGYVSSIAIAGGHVTNDIAVALSTPSKSAEAIKLEYGQILSSGYRGGHVITVEALSNQSSRKISVDLLAEVIEARYHEIFVFVKRKLKASQLSGAMPGGIVITGGASKIPGLQAFADRFFDCQVRLAAPALQSGEETLTDPGFSVAAGLVLQALEERDRMGRGRTGTVGQLWKRFQYWLDYHL